MKTRDHIFSILYFCLADNIANVAHFSISGFLPQHLGLCTSFQRRLALLDTTHFLSFYHDSHPVSHSTGPWVNVSRECIVPAGNYFSPELPLHMCVNVLHHLKCDEFHQWWNEPRVLLAFQRTAANSFFHSVHCYPAAVNESRGKCVCWPNHIISNHLVLFQLSLCETDRLLTRLKGVSCLSMLRIFG